MKNLKVLICNCSNCVLNGAMDIAEAIESLNKIKVQLRVKAAIHTENVQLGNHSSEAPVVMVNNVEIKNAKAETVMSKVLSVLHETGGCI